MQGTAKPKGLAKIWREVKRPFRKIFVRTPPLTYKSYFDLSCDLRSNMGKIPKDIDLIVGVPKSGMIPAMMIGLNLNTSTTDLSSFLEGRIYSHGYSRTHNNQKRSIFDCKKILVVDDSISSGVSMRRAREQVEQVTQGLDVQLFFMAIYATESAKGSVDFYCRIIHHPRIFEWNLMHSWTLNHSCVDIDGVLCTDPTETQNDDGERYVEFLEKVSPIFVPSRPIKMLVTNRLEKYRPQTENWLTKHGIVYESLVMLDLPSKKERIRLQAHGTFKADVYKKTQCILFIESDRSQAETIAKIARKPVLSVEDQKLLSAFD